MTQHERFLDIQKKDKPQKAIQRNPIVSTLRVQWSSAISKPHGSSTTTNCTGLNMTHPIIFHNTSAVRVKYRFRRTPHASSLLQVKDVEKPSFSICQDATAS